MPGATGAGGAAGVGGSSGAGANGSGGSGSGASSGAGAASGYTIDPEESWHQPAMKASLLFAPNDDLEDRVLAELEGAEVSLHLAFFNVRLTEVRDLLAQKVLDGLDVHVLLDKKQQDLDYNTMYEELQELDVPVTLIDNNSATDATMHDKFTVIDGKRVLAGSANYSYTALNVSDEDLLLVEDSALAARYETEFDELIADGYAASAVYGPGTELKTWFGPEDDLDEQVVAALDGAQDQALVAMFDLNRATIVDALIAAHGRGVQVIVILDEVQATDTGADADEDLAAAGIEVVLAHNTSGMQAEMHSKLLVVDHQLTLMGSYNWTSLASFYNDENLLVIDDAHLAARAQGKIAELVDSYADQTAAALGLTTGDQAVTFEVGNVTLDPGVTVAIKSIGGGPFATPVDLTSGAVSAMIAAGTRVDYRYEIREGTSQLVVESGQHSFTVPYASGPFTVEDAFTP